MDQRTIFLFVLLGTFSLFLVGVQGRPSVGSNGDGGHGPLYNLKMAPWLKHKEKKKTAVKQEDVYEDEPGDIIQIASKGFNFISKVSDVVGTATTLKDGIEFVIGLIDPSSSPATAKDIEELKKQIEKTNAFIKEGFARVLAGQEFLQVITIYTRYVDRLDFVVGTVVPKYLGDGSPNPSVKDKFIKAVQGGEGPDSTEYALTQVHKMIEASGFFNSKGLYTALAEKMANCKTCQFNINGMPLFASQFNTLQAGAYGAYIAGLEAKEDKKEAKRQEEAMLTRMSTQVGLLAQAQSRFVEIAGSGNDFLKLRSARGGCLDFQAQTVLGYHLVECSKAPKWRVGVEGGLRIEASPDECVGTGSSGLAGIRSLCDKQLNQWFMEFSNKDPRYFSLRSKDSIEKLCIASNVRIVDGLPKVDMRDCASLDEEDVLMEDENNTFWEFIDN